MNNYTLHQKKLVNELEKSFAQGKNKSTVVKMQDDYINDEQITLTSVVFIPSNISKKIIQNVVKPLREIEPEHYYYPPESMHLTIKNVRTINKPPLFNKSDIIKANELFNKIITQFPCFEFNVEDVLLFPTSISVMAYSNNTLQELVQALDKGLREIGVPDNKRYISDSVFWGNITICRFIKNPGNQFVETIKNMRNIKIGRFKVEKVSLISSNVVISPKSKKIIAEYMLSNN